MNNNTFLALFGLNPNDFKPVVSDPYESDTGTTFYLEQRTDTNRTCAYCASDKVQIKGYFDVLLKCTINFIQKHKLIVRKVRFIWMKCMKTYSPRLHNTNNHIKALIKNSYGLSNFGMVRKCCTFMSRNRKKR